MRIIFTSDLHYNIARSAAPTEAVAKRIREAGGDALVLVGDTASTDLRVLERALSLFDGFRGAKLAVAGNHELWTVGGADSLHRYENELAEVFSRNGFHYLDREPFIADGVAIVGSVGWYDYSFRSSVMGIPLRFFQRKVAPGAASRLEEHQDLLTNSDDVSEAAMQVTTRWMDGVRVKLPMSDAAFTERLAMKLSAHLQSARQGADRIVATIHHLPFAELVPHSVIPDWEFATAFHGAELFGEVLLQCPEVSHLFCGHIHRERRVKKAHIQCCSIGCTYTDKTYEVLDV